MGSEPRCDCQLTGDRPHAMTCPRYNHAEPDEQRAGGVTGDCDRGLRSVHDAVLKQRNAFHEELVDLRAALAAAERERDDYKLGFENATIRAIESHNAHAAATSRAETAEGLLRGHEALLNTLRIGVNAARGTPDEDAVVAAMLRAALQSLKGGSEP